jgi:ABC-type glycerol-3-phosphate transport system substrate-binding protein
MKSGPNILTRRFALLAGALALLAAIATVSLLAGASKPVTIRLVAPFKDERRFEAFRSELREFELRERHVAVVASQSDFADIDRRTASDSGDWDIAIGSSALADGRPGVASPALPLFGTLWLLYYNKAVLEKAGILPAMGASGLPGALASGSASVADLREACAAVAKAGAVPVALGSAYGWPLAVWIEAFMAADGSTGDAARLIASDFDPGSPAIAKAIAEFKALAASGAVDPAHATKDWPQALRDLVAGKAGFCLLNEELVASLPPAERSRIGTLPLPGSAGSGGKGWAMGSIAYIAQRSGEKGRLRAEARALAAWLTSEGASERLSGRLGLTFYAGGRGPYLVLPSISSIPASPVVARIKQAVAGGR